MKNQIQERALLHLRKQHPYQPRRSHCPEHQALLPEVHRLPPSLAARAAVPEAVGGGIRRGGGSELDQEGEGEREVSFRREVKQNLQWKFKMQLRNCTCIIRQQALSDFPNFAWKFLAAEVLLEKENTPPLHAISAINELLMIAVQKLNSHSHPAESFFKKKLQSLMIRPSVNKTLLENPNKRTGRQRRDVLSSCLNIQRAERMSRLKAFIAITEQNDPHLVLRMVEQSSQIMEKNSANIFNEVDLQKQQIQNRIRQRRNKSIRSKQHSEAPPEEQLQFSDKKQKKGPRNQPLREQGSRSATSFNHLKREGTKRKSSLH